MLLSGILVFFTAFLYKFKLLVFRVKDAAGTVDHPQNTQASPGPVEAYSCRSKSVPNYIV